MAILTWLHATVYSFTQQGVDELIASFMSTLVPNDPSVRCRYLADHTMFELQCPDDMGEAPYLHFARICSQFIERDISKHEQPDLMEMDPRKVFRLIEGSSHNEDMSHEEFQRLLNDGARIVREVNEDKLLIDMAVSDDQEHCSHHTWDPSHQDTDIQKVFTQSVLQTIINDTGCPMQIDLELRRVSVQGPAYLTAIRRLSNIERFAHRNKITAHVVNLERMSDVQVQLMRLQDQGDNRLLRTLVPATEASLIACLPSARTCRAIRFGANDTHPVTPSQHGAPDHGLLKIWNDLSLPRKGAAEPLKQIRKSRFDIPPTSPVFSPTTSPGASTKKGEQISSCAAQVASAPADGAQLDRNALADTLDVGKDSSVPPKRTRKSRFDIPPQLPPSPPTASPGPGADMSTEKKENISQWAAQIPSSPTDSPVPTDSASLRSAPLSVRTGSSKRPVWEKKRVSVVVPDTLDFPAPVWSGPNDGNHFPPLGSNRVLPSQLPSTVAANVNRRADLILQPPPNIQRLSARSGNSPLRSDNGDQSQDVRYTTGNLLDIEDGRPDQIGSSGSILPAFSMQPLVAATHVAVDSVEQPAQAEEQLLMTFPEIDEGAPASETSHEEDLEDQERIQPIAEFDTRHFFRTMDQQKNRGKGGKGKGKGKSKSSSHVDTSGLPLPDPPSLPRAPVSPSPIKQPKQQIVKGRNDLLQVLEHARCFRGHISIDIQLGQALIHSARVGDATRFLNTSMSKCGFERDLAMHQASRNLEVYFSRMLTTSVSDACQIPDVHLFEQDPYKTEAFYELALLDRNNEAICIKISEGTDGIQIFPQVEELGAVFLHNPERVWDARFIVTGRSGQQVPDAIQKFARTIKVELRGERSEVPRILYRVESGEIAVQAASAKRCLYHRSLKQQDVTLKVTEVRLLELRQEKIDLRNQIADADVRSAIANRHKLWFEAELQINTDRNPLLAQNLELKLGEEADWEPEDIISDVLLEDFNTITEQLVIHLDRVGLHNRGPRGDTQDLLRMQENAEARERSFF